MGRSAEWVVRGEMNVRLPELDGPVMTEIDGGKWDTDLFRSFIFVGI